MCTHTCVVQMIERELPLILNGIEKINPALAMGDQVRLIEPRSRAMWCIKCRKQAPLFEAVQ
jgi:hypothetical protein